MRFIGSPFTFGFSQVGTNCGLIGQHALSYSDGIVFWMSIPRSLGALRFTSFVSFGISMFVVCTVFVLSFGNPTDEEHDHPFGERMSTAF